MMEQPMRKPLPHQKPRYILKREVVESQGPKETVEEFLARGGKVTKLPAPWSGKVPERKPADKSSWGNWGSYSG